MDDQGPLRPPDQGGRRRPDRHRGGPDSSGPRRRAQVISRAEQRAQAVAAIASVIPGPGDAGGMAAMAAVEELRLVVEELRAADDELRAQNTELEMALHCAQDEHCRAFE